MHLLHLMVSSKAGKRKLEPVFCKKQQKKFLTSYWFVEQLYRGPLKILNGIRLIQDVQGIHLDSYTISLESFRSFRGPLFLKPVTGQEFFLLFLTANRLQVHLGNQIGIQWYQKIYGVFILADLRNLTKLNYGSSNNYEHEHNFTLFDHLELYVDIFTLIVDKSNNLWTHLTLIPNKR